MSAENEDSDPQERNLIKSRFHSHSKTVHKDLIKKSTGGKKVVSYKHTQNGTYEGVPTDQDDASNDEIDTSEKESKLGSDTERKAAFIAADLQVSLDSKKYERGGDKQSNLSAATEPAYANEPSETDPMVLVLADVHKATNAKTEMVSITTDKTTRAGNIYVGPSELKPVVMSTFGPGATSTPKSNPDHGTSTADDIFENVAKKYQIEAPWFTAGFASMGDIPEDPREDDQSVVSGSAVSTSMYGSSEIFDSADANTYYNLDSDLDVLPLDAEDVLSDGGLPSPMGYPLYRTYERGKVNDDIKLIPGALKSPAAHTGRMVNPTRPRPNSSIILRTRPIPESLDNSSAVENESEESPPLPPPPEEKTQPQAETVFEFPPPPKFYKPPQHIVWREQQKAERDSSGMSGGNYAQRPQSEEESESSDTQSQARNQGGRGARGTLSPT